MKPKRKTVTASKPAPPAPPQRVRPQDLEESTLAELKEEEILVVLQVLATKSPEAQEMLDDVMRRIHELQRFDTFRQI